MAELYPIRSQTGTLNTVYKLFSSNIERLQTAYKKSGYSVNSVFHGRDMHFIHKEHRESPLTEVLVHGLDDFYEHASVLMEDLLTLVVLRDLNCLLNQVCYI